MRFIHSSLFALILTGASASAAGTAVVTVTNNYPDARPGAVVAVKWDDVFRLLPQAMIDHLVVRDSKGNSLPYQVLNFQPDEHRDYYLDLIFQHDFAAGEKTAQFTIEDTGKPIPPFAPQVFARYIPERFDDFAWENDKVAHRIYGPGLDTPAAGSTRMISSGIDIWSKRVPYPIVDRWYLKGHYHDDTGEGLDMYDVGTTRGAGGTGVWNGEKLLTSQNWASWKVLANGPIRAVFEITYAPWDLGNGAKIAETKRFTVDAGRNYDMVESTYALTGADEATVAIGITRHGPFKTEVTKNENLGLLTLWEETPRYGKLGVGVMLAPSETPAGFAQEPPAGRDNRGNELLLVKVKPDQTLRYYAGAGWDRAGEFTTQAEWDAYSAAFARRLRSPLVTTIAAGPAR